MYYCPFCQRTYPTSNHIKAHLNLKHSVDRYKNFQCQQPKCWRSFSNSSSYLKHLTLKHPLPIKSMTLPKLTRPENIAQSVSHNADLDASPNNAVVEAGISNSDNFTRHITMTEFRELVSDGCASLAAKLYANNSINRSVVQDIIESVDELYSSTCIKLIKDKYNSNNCNVIDNECNEMLDILINGFGKLKTEHHRFKFFTSCSTFIKPISFVVGTSLAPKSINTSKLDVVDLTAQFIPMGEVIKKFLELPHVFSEIVSYINELKLDESHSFVHTKLWIEIEEKFGINNNVVLPLTIYFDDFEVNNPLGSHKGINKLGAIYFTLGCIPPQYSSLLENIFLAQLHNSEDQKTFGNRSIFRRLIQEIVILENHGISILVGTEKKQVYFVLTKILGDNLGLQSILGFNQSFNANYVCRFCRIDKPTLQSQLSEDPSMLRTKANYVEDLLRNQYGIVEKCIFNENSSYHFTASPTCDIAHDYLEGVFRYGMGKICHVLINADKLFSLQQLNDRIRYFNFGTAVVGNNPPTISQDGLKKQVIMFSASEMLCFVYYFGLIIGDLVPTHNKVWQIYVVMRQILSIIMARSIRIETANLLRALVEQHHSLYLQIFKESLKPKHHFMVHHPTSIEKCGPLCDMSTIRFEGRHREFKQNAKVVTSRLNISYTLALKNQLKLNYRFMAKNGFEKRISMGSGYEVDLTDLGDYNLFKNALPVDFDFTQKYLCVPSVIVDGITYKPGNVLVWSMENDLLQFGQIRHILVDEARDVHFIFVCMDNLCLVEHIHAFETAMTNKWSYTLQKNLTTYRTYDIHIMSDGKCYVPCD